jgi:hypothetical protein
LGLLAVAMIFVTNNSLTTIQTVSYLQKQITSAASYNYLTDLAFSVAIDIVVFNATNKVRGKPVLDEQYALFDVISQVDQFITQFKAPDGTYTETQ